MKQTATMSLLILGLNGDFVQMNEIMTMSKKTLIQSASEPTNLLIK
jgi:hypothetical protein